MAYKRQHITICYETETEGDLSLDQWIAILERLLPGGSMVTVGPHTGYCVAGDSAFAPNGVYAP